MRSRILTGIIASALVCLATLNVSAQVTASATLQGTVTDKTGAVIPGAEVKVTNTATGEVRSASSNAEGLYTFSLLPAGIYQVRVTLKGFTTAAYENVELSVSRTTTIDAQLVAQPAV